MRRGVLALGAWIVVTTAATVVTWLGVGAVTRAVTASEPAIPPATLAAQSPSVPAQLAASTTTTTTTATTTTVPAPLPQVSAGRSNSSPAPAPAVTTTTTTTTAPVTSSSPKPTQPVSTTSSTTASVPATYSSPGGQATVSCSGDEIHLVNAFPANGYQLTVDNGGPKVVTVSFSGSGTEYQISAACQNGSPVRVEGG